MTAEGEPDPILLLHGQPGGARDWDRVTAAVGGRAPTIAIDRPGWDGVAPARGVFGNAASALAVLDAAGAERATIVGHSFGAAVAAVIAADHPERVRGLVLIAPAANVASLYRLDRWLAAPLAGPVLSAASLAAAGLIVRERRTRGAIAHRLGLGERYLEDAGRALRRPAGWRAFVREQRALIRELPLVEQCLGQIRSPTTIMIGSADVVVPPASSRRLAEQIPGAELVWIEGTGHLLPLRQAQRVAEVVLLAHDR